MRIWVESPDSSHHCSFISDFASSSRDNHLLARTRKKTTGLLRSPSPLPVPKATAKTPYNTPFLLDHGRRQRCWWPINAALTCVQRLRQVARSCHAERWSTGRGTICHPPSPLPTHAEKRVRNGPDWRTVPANKNNTNNINIFPFETVTGSEHEQAGDMPYRYTLYSMIRPGYNFVMTAV